MMELGTAIFFIFCTPFGWVGLLCLAIAISSIPVRRMPAPTVEPLVLSNRCRDFDEDCKGVENKAKCWLHAPEQGRCPYLLPPTGGRPRW